ncbi:hypothetical protein [Snodgrassella sp. ESL0323]|uniref:hypothetical protein n=1 Tax=Snodgrassella sp. ESL0323 TaxID=2705034 RepID=UPI001FCF1A3A|nr:hypothetical protein [Snodgrassella sp. ESL0323]
MTIKIDTDVDHAGFIKKGSDHAAFYCRQTKCTIFPAQLPKQRVSRKTTTGKKIGTVKNSIGSGNHFKCAPGQIKLFMLTVFFRNIVSGYRQAQ